MLIAAESGAPFVVGSRAHPNFPRPALPAGAKGAPLRGATRCAQRARTRHAVPSAGQGALPARFAAPSAFTAAETRSLASQVAPVQHLIARICTTTRLSPQCAYHPAGVPGVPAPARSFRLQRGVLVSRRRRHRWPRGGRRRGGGGGWGVLPRGGEQRGAVATRSSPSLRSRVDPLSGSPFPRAVLHTARRSSIIHHTHAPPHPPASLRGCGSGASW